MTKLRLICESFLSNFHNTFFYENKKSLQINLNLRKTYLLYRFMRQNRHKRIENYFFRRKLFFLFNQFYRTCYLFHFIKIDSNSRLYCDKCQLIWMLNWQLTLHAAGTTVMKISHTNDIHKSYFHYSLTHTIASSTWEANSIQHHKRHQSYILDSYVLIKLCGSCVQYGLNAVLFDSILVITTKPNEIRRKNKTRNRRELEHYNLCYRLKRITNTEIQITNQR